MIELKLDTVIFEEWLFGLHHFFIEMVQTMVDVFEVFKETINRHGFVPLDTGRLESSFHYQIYQNTNFIELWSIYSAVDPDSNYDYAFYQHELERVRFGYGTGSAYSYALAGNPKDNHHRHGFRGTDHYLYKGIDTAMSEGFMWTIIEEDYMQLFNGGL